MNDKIIQRSLKFKPPMDTLTAVGIADGSIECDDHDQFIEAWQYLIDTGTVWSLQGWFGRTAENLIEEGYCKFPERNQ